MRPIFVYSTEKSYYNLSQYELQMPYKAIVLSICRSLYVFDTIDLYSLVFTYTAFHTCVVLLQKS